MSETPMTQVERAFEGIRRLISSGSLAPGDRLPQRAGAVAEFDVSRSSLREAQKMLGFAGVLISRTGAGAYVSALTPQTVMSGLSVTIPLLPLEEYLGLFDIRQLLEGFAAAQAAAGFDDAERARLLEIAEDLAARSWVDDGSTLDDAFHELLATGARDWAIAVVLRSMRQRGRHYRVFERHDAAELELATGSIAASPRRCGDRDPVRAQLAATAHIRATREWLEGLRPAPEP